MSYLHSALVALQFLTQIPVKFRQYPPDATVARSLVFYPLIGLLIGLLLWAVAAMLTNVSAMLVAAIILSVWVVITGALHLDGLADSCDAWIGGHGDKQRTLEIMKDPCSGPIAIVLVFCTLLLKYAALVSIIEQNALSVLIIAPLLARSLIPILLLKTPYVSLSGIAQVLVNYAPRRQVFISCVLGVLLSWYLGSLMGVVIACLVLFSLRAMMIKRIQGLTGDTAGASLELLEMATLVVIAISI